MAKSGYKKEYAAQARKLCELGAVDADVADFFGVNRTTLWRWAARNKELAEAMTAGKDIADNRVERSLYHRAIGYSHPDVHVSNYQGEITLTPIEKHYPPDTGACVFWLKNRKGWRDRQEHTGADGGPIQTEYGPNELARRLAFVIAQGVHEPKPE
jgi:hypothetical protein